MSSTTKAWIKAIRVIQLLARALQFIGAAGILVLVILITDVPSLTTWVLRITVCLSSPRSTSYGESIR